MGQLTIYLPDEDEQRLRTDAERSGLSVSAYVRRRVFDAPGGEAWSDWLGRTFGSCPDLELPDDRDLAPLDETEL